MYTLCTSARGVACAWQCIDAVLTRVDGMVALVEGLDFSPLEPAHAGRWAAARAQFNSAGEEVKLATRDLINTCFRRARQLAPALGAAPQHTHYLGVTRRALIVWSAAKGRTARLALNVVWCLNAEATQLYIVLCNAFHTKRCLS